MIVLRQIRPGIIALWLSVALTVSTGDAQAKLNITTASLPGGTVGVPYSQLLQAGGGRQPYTWSISAGSLPPGLSLNGTTGVISGTPATAGTFEFTVQVQDAARDTETRKLSITVAAPVAITTASLPGAVAGRAYSQTLAATGGTTPYQWTIAAGTLPGGLSLDRASGTIAGTPTTAGTFTFTAQVTDSGSRTATAPLSITVIAALSVTTATLPRGTVGTAYSQTLAATGGVAPYTWTIAGTLPPGLALSGATIAGTPTTAGTYNFTAQVADSAQNTATHALTIAIDPPALQITSGAPPAGTAGQPYSFTFTASGGTPPYTWSVTGSLPAGLTLSGATISGTPTTPGTSNFTVRVSDAQGSATSAVSITVNPAALDVTTTSLPAGTVGTAYSQQLAAGGGTPPYSWSVTAGSLPAGLTLSGSTIGGTPTAAGTATFTVQARDAAGVTATRELSIAVNAPALRITTTTLPTGTVGTAYSQAVAATGGTTPYTWTVIGNLPAGLSLSGSTISGTPSAAGTFSLTLQVTDANQTVARQQVSITISAPTLQITTTALPAAVAGTPYSRALSATGGVPPYRWAVTGNLPAGLSLSGDTIGGMTISGVPTTPGTSSFTLRVTDSAGTSASRDLSLTVNAPALEITTASLPQAAAGAAYSQSLAAAGGVPPYRWSIGGDLPPGLTLSGNTISGTPTAAGSYSFSLQATDAANQRAARAVTLDVLAELRIVTPSLADAAVGTAYSQTLRATGGTPPYTWSVSGALPDGIALDAAAGTLSGTPVSAGRFQFTLAVRDSAGQQVSRPYTVTAAAGLTITSAPVLPAATVGNSYSQALAAAGGRQPYTWSVSAGALPGGVSLNSSTGALSGRPAAAGQFEFTVTVTDNASARATKAFTLTVAASLVISSAPNLPDGGTGTPYAQPLSAGGGTPPYLWAVESGSLPQGLALDANSGMLSGTPGAAGQFTFTARVTDSVGASATKQFQVRILAGLQITSGTLPAGSQGAPYSVTLGAAGGAPPYSWSIIAGALPPGLALNAASGTIAGTPAENGSFTFTVRVTDAAGLTATREQAIAVGVPSLPTVSINGGGDVLEPLQQPAVTVALAAPYPMQITGQLTLGFEPDAAVPVDDPAVQFSTGGRTAAFTIPANTTAASFSAPAVAFQTGTVAGTIRLSLTMRAGGADLTPRDGAIRAMRVMRSEPKIIAGAAAATNTGFEVRITGLASGRELSTAEIRLNPAAGSDLQTTSLSVPLGDVAARWYRDATSTQFGSQFLLTMPFTVNGNLRSIESVTVTLSNQSGASAPATVRF